MTQNFFALCRPSGWDIDIKRIQVSNPLQTEIAQLFAQQEQTFFNGVSDVVEFDGDLKPDSHHLLYIDDFPEQEAVAAAITSNASSIETLTLERFGEANIKAIFTGYEADGVVKVLVQKFDSRQLLSNNKLSMMLDNNTFSKVVNPVFTLGNSLACVIEGNRLKFKSFHNAKCIFTLKSFFQAATNEDIDAFFAEDSKLSIGDIENFKDDVADQETRKLIHSIHTKRDLNQYTTAQIQERASQEGLTLSIDDDKIVVPDDKRQMKLMLHFLNDGLYKASLSGTQYISNSKQPVQD